MDKRRIYIVYEFLSEQGGLEREIINHANFLKQSGYIVKVLTCHLDKKIFDALPFGNIDVEYIGKIDTRIEWLNILLCFLGLNKLNRYNPDAFLSYSFPSNFLIKSKKSIKINYINHFPHFLYLEKKELKEWAMGTEGIKRKLAVLVSFLFRNRLKRMDHQLVKKNNLILVNSMFTQRVLENLYQIKTKVSYPPIDTKIKSTKSLIKQKFVFSSSRIIPDKKYEWLIEAMSLAKNKLPLYLAGNVINSYKAKLLDLAVEKKIHIKFLGKLKTPELIKYYSSAEVFAFPTPKEDFGLVPAESLACGTPVIIWGDESGPTEQIIDGKNGYQAKPYDLKDFADKIDLAIKSQIKTKNRKKIIDSAKKFTARSLRKEFVREIDKLFKKQENTRGTN